LDAGPLALNISLPLSSLVDEDSIKRMISPLPFSLGLRCRVDAVEGVRSLMGLQICTVGLRILRLAELEEDEVGMLCALLMKCRCLEALHVEMFCRDDPSAERLAPVLASLPSSCLQIIIRYALPVSSAFALVPTTVRCLGTLVLMWENYYHSRVVGMTLSRFKSNFPVLDHIQSLEVVLGPGHYEEPEWPTSTPDVAALILVKFPALRRLRVTAVVESVVAPPLVDLTIALVRQHVVFEVTELRPLAAARELVPLIKRQLQQVGARFVFP